MSVRPESMADELENAKRAIDAWSKLSWAEQNREMEKVRAHNLAALKADKRLFMAFLPNGQSMTATPWDIYKEKARLGYLNSWERMLGTLSNIEGGVGGTVGYALGGEEGAEVGARVFDDWANTLGHVPESSRATEARGTAEYQHGAPLVEDAQRLVLREPIAPTTALDPLLPREPAAPLNRKPVEPPPVPLLPREPAAPLNRKPVEPPPIAKDWKPPEYAREEVNRKPPPRSEPPNATQKPPPKEPPTIPTQGTANRLGGEQKPRDPAPPVVPFGSIDLPLEVLPLRNSTPRKAPAKAKKPAPATVGAPPAQQSNTAQAGAAPKKESAPKSPASTPANKPPANSAASDANKLVTDVARGLRKPEKPAKAAESAKPSQASETESHKSTGLALRRLGDPPPKNWRELEERVIAELRRGAPNSGPTYYRSESHKVAKIYQEFVAFAQRLRKAGYPDPIPRPEPKVLEITRKELIKETPLGEECAKITEQLEERVAEAFRRVAESGGDKKALGKAEFAADAYWKWVKWLNVRVGDQMLDAFELNPAAQQVGVIDPSFAWGDPLHNLKSRVYLESLNRLLGWEGGSALDVGHGTFHSREFQGTPAPPSPPP
ncbi:MAG: hypothetical protein ACJ780_26415 [Solirubrobacteraceae bacterium]